MVEVKNSSIGKWRKTMKNNLIISTIIIMISLASASVLAMNSNTSTTKRYNGSLTEKQALQKALEQSKKDAQQAEKSKREQIAQDAAMAAKLQRQSMPQMTQAPRSVKSQAKNNNNNQASLQAKQTAKKYTSARDASGNIQLPRDLQGKHLTHLAVSRQTDSTSCGYHATFNAWAFQELITREIPVTGENIQQLACQHHHLILPDHLLEIGYSNNPEKPDYILELAQRIGLTDNLYFLNYHAKGNPINHKIFDDGGVQESLNHGYGEFLQTIRYRDDEGVLVGHIICDYNNGHWTTFSVVKRPNHVPEIYYMNSTNAPLAIDSSGYAVAKHIVELVGS